MRRVRNHVIDVLNEAGAPYGYKIPKDGPSRSLVRDNEIWGIIECLQNDLKTAKDALENNGEEWLPVRHGTWEKRPAYQFYNGDFLVCSECHSEFVLPQKYNYCPVCGARMDGKETRCK